MAVLWKNITILAKIVLCQAKLPAKPLIYHSEWLEGVKDVNDGEAEMPF